MDIHVTEIDSFLRCRRKWDYASSNRQNLEPVVNAPALTLGTLIHNAIDLWSQYPDLDPLTFYNIAAIVALDDIHVSYAERIGVGISESEIEPLEKAIELGRAMIRNYREYYQAPMPVGWTIVASETPFRLPIPNTPHYLCGKLDKIVTDSQGRLYVLDIKTFSQMPTDEVLQFNPQFLKYTLALRLLYPDKRTVAVAYDGLRKRAEPAKGKTTDDLFYRKMFYRTEHELEEAYANLTVVAREMEAAAIYPSRAWDCHINCASAFRSMCAAESRGDDVDYLRNRLTQPRKSAEIEKEEIE